MTNAPHTRESDTLLPCPFCGRDPETHQSGEGGRGLMIDCITKHCVNPHVSYYDHATARAIWNRRISTPIPLTPSDEMVAVGARAIMEVATEGNPRFDRDDWITKESNKRHGEQARACLTAALNLMGGK